MNYKIAAVVVTYNRLELLKHCIQGLRTQSYKLDKIIIVNNSSTDGTLDWLNNQGDLYVITQENLGGAGGFYTGIKLAYEMGFDWIWCFDDDCLPTINCLKSLITQAKNFHLDVISPIPLVDQNGKVLSFLTPVPENKDVNNTWNLEDIRKYLNDKEILKGWASFFNGVLISKNVIESIGYPNKNLFIWGDEIDYFNRIKNNNFNIGASITATLLHPPNLWKPKIKILDKWIYDLELDWRAYYYFRNYAFLSKSKNRFFDIKFILAHLYYFSKLNGRSLYSVKFFLIAYWNGLTSNFIQYKL